MGRIREKKMKDGRIGLYDGNKFLGIKQGSSKKGGKSLLQQIGFSSGTGRNNKQSPGFLDMAVKYVKEKQPKKVLLVTECTMSDNVQVENPNVQFVKPCNLCPHMKKITLNKIYDCLKNETNEIKIGHNIAEMARKSVLRMAEIGR